MFISPVCWLKTKVCDAVPVLVLMKATWEPVHTYVLRASKHHSRIMPWRTPVFCLLNSRGRSGSTGAPHTKTSSAPFLEALGFKCWSARSSELVLWGGKEKKKKEMGALLCENEGAELKMWQVFPLLRALLSHTNQSLNTDWSHFVSWWWGP